ncbi:hypothetical protein GGS23DRAFT_567522 [Durotheca rogersii]|uniref:uncharacterized protein n=1 Tax=Durotheca rogersii TaxID=419775 RepID=UPI00221EE232|nr:uncharacterized protein GGS23DRAFT_567522 [Durotheca rogersii]KAI5863545.1 hypothetical protein GGS23DRAFT_567522 [Durotheca rogersii]
MSISPPNITNPAPTMATSTPTPAPPSASALTPAPVSSQDAQPTVRFTTAAELFEQIDSVPGDILIVTNVSRQDFTAIEHERETRRRKIRFRRYYASTQILIVTIPTIIHEQLHRRLYEGLCFQVNSAGLWEDWSSLGGATFREGRPSGNSGEGDSSGGPRSAGRGAWPTLVIEAGVSESLRQLQEDMRWWFAASNHDVKIVILAKSGRSQNRIILQKWIEQQRQPRQGATSTRWASTLEPTLHQTITITGDSANPALYNVTRGALVLEFRLLFLRDPRQGEGDFVVDVPSLQRYAAAVWT